MSLRPALKYLPVLLLAASLSAQNDTVGGLNRAAGPAATWKGNLFKVDKTVTMLKQEWYLKFTGVNTLTFFRYRHHKQQGTYTLEWTHTVQATGTGAGWYSSGIKPTTLVAGNHYILGCMWTQPATYYFNIVTGNTPVSFGSWYRGVTPTSLPKTYSIVGKDVAQYYQRLTTLANHRLINVGQPCPGPYPARLVTATLASSPGQCVMDLVEAEASRPAIFVLVPGKTLTTPIPIFGCSLWVNPANGIVLTVALMTSAAGEARLTLPLPTGLTGLVISWQTLILGTKTTPLSNALQFTL
jgi:hypothetical protein